MKRYTGLLSAIVMVFGVGFGIVLSIKKQNSHANQHLANTPYYLIPSDVTCPVISELEIRKDPYHGYNLHFETENFVLTAGVEEYKLDSSLQMGHAHLELNGVKIARVYHNWYHISEPIPSNAELRLVLTNHQHEILFCEKEAIERRFVFIPTERSDTSITSCNPQN